MINTHLIKQPVVTEKSLTLANEQNVYTFEVDKLANKNQIAETVAAVYQVDVLRVRTIKRQPTTRSTGKKRSKSLTAQTKKALVTLKKGQTIEVFDISA
jgi:large subunit ribosomal protein L23